MELKTWVIVIIFAILFIAIAVGGYTGYNYHKNSMTLLIDNYTKRIEEKEAIIKDKEKAIEESENRYSDLVAQIGRKVTAAKKITSPKDLTETKKRFKEAGYETK